MEELTKIWSPKEVRETGVSSTSNLRVKQYSNKSETIFQRVRFPSESFSMTRGVEAAVMDGAAGSVGSMEEEIHLHLLQRSLNAVKLH